MERAVYRIIDANFNRSREGLRVMEEFCRFALDNYQFSSRCKQLRHDLTRAVDRFDADKLITSRDSANDVGSTTCVEQQMTRRDLKDCFTAAAKRAAEALRALAEVSQVIDSAAAAEFERIRFQVYTLEKDVVSAVWAGERFSKVRLYVLVTVSHNDSYDKAIELTDQCAAAGADCIQLRCKGINDAEMLKLAIRFVQVCRDKSVISMINDRPDIALASQADGAHLGDEDMPIEYARKLGARPLILGVTTHNVGQLKKAIESGADYVGIGPIFGSRTKPGLDRAGLEYAAEAMQVLAGTGVGHVAIGGVDIDNLDLVLKTGVQAVAVCSAVSAANSPAEACRSFKCKLK